MFDHHVPITVAITWGSRPILDNLKSYCWLVVSQSYSKEDFQETGLSHEMVGFMPHVDG